MVMVGDAKDCLVSGGPRGLKREFAFVSSQAELTTSVRRTRASVEGNGHPENDDTVEPKTKSKNKTKTKAKTEAPDMSELKKPSLKLKDLMKSGLLEGLQVKYIRGPKMRGPTVTLKGIISGAGILCSCDSCEGNKVVSPNKFEVHAGSGNKRPAEYIYLENGKNLRYILNVCKDTPLEDLVLAVQNSISCASEKEPISKVPVCGSPEDPATIPDRILKESENDYLPATVGEISKPNSPRFLVNPEPSVGITTGSEEKETSFQVSLPLSLSVNKPQGRLTKKDNRLHKLVFDDIKDGTPVEYMARKEVVKSGLKMGIGIECSCCGVRMSPSQFEAHAGWGSRRKPYLHTFVEGSSLHELAVRLSRTAKISDDIKDTLCTNCKEGDEKGELKSCDSCPRVFHTACIPLLDDPKNDFHCKYCRNNFQTEKNATRVRGRVPKADDDGGCTLCGCHDFTDHSFGPRTVMVCDQCEREYHVSCLKKHKRDDLKELPEGEWLCCTECKLIHKDLHDRLARGEVDLTESSMSHIKRKMEANGSATGAELDIKWRLFRGKMVPKDTKTMLTQAESLFHNRFDPIMEPHPKLPGIMNDLITGMVYGKLDHGDSGDLGGMYCGVLSVNSIVACAAVFRIFGSEVAELPLVATSVDFERLGYFQAIFSCIEDILTDLSVKDLVLPAAKDAKSMWTNKFGFEEMSDDEMKRYRKRYPMMAFHGTTTLHKSIKKENVV